MNENSTKNKKNFVGHQSIKCNANIKNFQKKKKELRKHLNKQQITFIMQTFTTAVCLNNVKKIK